MLSVCKLLSLCFIVAANAKREGVIKSGTFSAPVEPAVQSGIGKLVSKADLKYFFYKLNF